MKLIVSQPKGQRFLPFITVVLLIVLSLTLAAWQVLAVENDGKINSDVQIYLPMFQAVLMILAVALGLTFHSVRTARIKSKDILGLTHDGAGDSFKNTEAILGIAAGGLIRVDPEFNIEYINESAGKYCGWDDRDAQGKSIYEIVKVQNTNDKNTLKKMLEKQLEYESGESDWTEMKLLNPNGDLHLLKIKVTPIYNDFGKIKHLVLILQDITSDRKVMKKLFDQASRDSLTGLINRHSFQDYMELVIADSEGTNTSNVLCYMDLDHFKTVNDVCGHAAGDELLRQISDMFSKRVRSTDRLARIGGDEFAILLPNCPMNAAKHIFNRILEDVRSFRFIWRQNTFVVGVSIGALEFDSGYRVSDIGHLMVAADEACYAAKKAGRNQLHIREMERHEISLANKDDDEGVTWETHIKNALESDNFALFVQPMNPLAEPVEDQTVSNLKKPLVESREKSAAENDEQLPRTKQSDDSHKQFYEILLRMKHENELLEPGSFMPTAERLNLMGRVDRWVIAKVIGMIEKTNAKNSINLDNVFSVNLSSDSVNDVDFPDFVKLLLEEHQVAASQLCFEVTESVALANFSKVQSLFTELAALGSSCALDDFGSGFSSLNYLRELPIKYLKVDGSFVRKMALNNIDAVMVEAINKVVQTMNIFTVAESVEDEKTAKLLAEMGINYGQGFHFGKPISIREIGTLQQAAA